MSSTRSRLRNTHEVHAWYPRTNGMSTTATQVMIFSVYGVEEAFAIVSEFSGVRAGMTFGNSAPKMKMTTAAIATVVEQNAHPSDRLAVRNTVATRAIAATSTGIQVRVCEE